MRLSTQDNVSPGANLGFKSLIGLEYAKKNPRLAKTVLGMKSSKAFEKLFSNYTNPTIKPTTSSPKKTSAPINKPHDTANSSSPYFNLMPMPSSTPTHIAISIDRPYPLHTTALLIRSRMIRLLSVRL